MKKKKMGYFGGGTYYCHRCRKTHHVLSEVGKSHIGSANKDIQKIIFRQYGIYSKKK